MKDILLIKKFATKLLFPKDVVTLKVDLGIDEETYSVNMIISKISENEIEGVTVGDSYDMVKLHYYANQIIDIEKLN